MTGCPSLTLWLPAGSLAAAAGKCWRPWGAGEPAEFPRRVARVTSAAAGLALVESWWLWAAV